MIALFLNYLVLDVVAAHEHVLLNSDTSTNSNYLTFTTKKNFSPATPASEIVKRASSKITVKSDILTTKANNVLTKLSTANPKKPINSNLTTTLPANTFKTINATTKSANTETNLTTQTNKIISTYSKITKPERTTIKSPTNLSSSTTSSTVKSLPDVQKVKTNATNQAADTLLTPTIASAGDCEFNGVRHAHGDVWIHRGLFNISCDNKTIKVVNCITGLGTPLSLGTHDFVEKDGYHYDCNIRTQIQAQHSLLTSTLYLGSRDENSAFDFVMECDKGATTYTRVGFLVSCEKERIIGCVDVHGDYIRLGYYVSHDGMLRNCFVSADGRLANSEPKGCFNGTRDDDPESTRFHVGFGERWSSGDFVLECGHDGFFVRQCLIHRLKLGFKPIDSKEIVFIDAGTAWIDSDGVFNVCQ